MPKTKMEEEFNLPAMDEMVEDSEPSTELPEEFAEVQNEIVSVEDALTVSEKINMALKEVRGMEEHDGEMDEIASEAIDAYKQLMDLGHNLQDMAAGTVFTSATQMLKVALDARDSKVNRKLKQIDMMLKKASLDHRVETSKKASDPEETQPQVLDRNDLLKMLNTPIDDKEK